MYILLFLNILYEFVHHSILFEILSSPKNTQ